MPRVQQFIGTTRTLYVETGGDWYRARLARSCFSLPDADRIGIAMTATDLFDGSSTVIADGERCPVAYVTPSIGPPVELLLNPDG
jgi:hypothetical protein